MGVDRIQDELQLRKFRQLKIAVNFLQEEENMFGRYCYYGCYCLPEGSHNIASGGYGKPGFRILLKIKFLDFNSSTSFQIVFTFIMKVS